MAKTVNKKIKPPDQHTIIPTKIKDILRQLSIPNDSTAKVGQLGTHILHRIGPRELQTLSAIHIP